MVRLVVAASLALTGLALDATTMPRPAAAAAADSVIVTGHGWGHGRGMGQYGAFGYAVDNSLNYQAILDHFYGGTALGTVDPNQLMSVLLCSLEGNITCTSPRDVGALLVTAGIPFTVEGVQFGGGTLVRIRHDGTQWLVETAPGGCGAAGGAFTLFGPSVDSGIDVSSTDGAPGEDRTRMLTVCNGSAKVYRGSIHAIRDAGNTRVVNIAPLDQYLRGVVPAESPASWGTSGGGKGMHALRAQAVAARSYAMSTQRHPYARTCDTIGCQVYNGANAESANTNQAIADTAGMVRFAGGAISRTEFSSSSGGWSAGGTYPAVVDEGDDVAANPNHNWQMTVPVASIQAAYPTIGQLVRFEVIERSGIGVDGGRVRRMNIVGTTGSVTVTGNDFRSKFGLKSDWFTPQNPPPPSGTTPPPSGKVTAWYLRNGVNPGSPDIQLAYGGTPAETIACDWDGNGTDTVGVYVAGTWYLRNANTPGPPDITVSYGAPGYQPVCGDWDGNGTDTIGVYVAGTWYVRNTNTPGAPNLTVAYGYSGTSGVVGDWNGDGVDTFGVFDHGHWFLRNSNTPGPPSTSVAYGGPRDLGVVGDWDGNGTDTIGVYVFDMWYLRDDLAAGPPTRTVHYGFAGTRAVPGNWDGVGGSGIGVIAVQ